MPTVEGWLYLAAVMDLFSRRRVPAGRGWAMGSRLTQELALQALNMALQQRRTQPALLAAGHIP